MSKIPPSTGISSTHKNSTQEESFAAASLSNSNEEFADSESFHSDGNSSNNEGGRDEDAEDVIPKELCGFFASANAFQTALKSWCKQSNQPFTVYGNAKLSQNKDLKWETVTIFCAHSGAPRVQVPAGKRQRLTYSKRCNCTARIRVVSSEKGLKVAWVQLAHIKKDGTSAHKTSREDLYASWPALRRECFQASQQAFEMGAKPSAVVFQVRKTTDVPVTRQDAANAFRKVKHAATNMLSPEDQVLATMEKWESRGTTFRVNTGSDGKLASLSLVTKEMKVTRDHSFRVLMIDSTYKCNINDYTLFNVITVDEHGKGFPIGQAFITNETAEMLDRALSDIEEMQGISLASVEIVLTDRDWAQLSVFERKLPQAKILLCSWHVLQNFWKQSRKVKGNRLKHELYLLARRMLHARAEEDFNAAHEALVKHAGDEGAMMVQHIKTSWLPVVEQWAHFHRTNLRAYSMNTNSKIERFNLLVKTAIMGSKKRRMRPSLGTAMDAMLEGLENTFMERKTVNMFRSKKNPVLKGQTAEGALQLLSKIASVAGFKAIMMQLNRHPLERIEIAEDSSSTILVRDTKTQKEYLVCTSDGTCTCSWQKTMGLPCQHAIKIFHTLRMSEDEMMLFVDELFLAKNTSFSSHLPFPHPEDIDSDEECPMQVEKESSSESIFQSQEVRINEVLADTRPLLNDIDSAIRNHPLEYVKMCQNFLRQLANFFRDGAIPQTVDAGSTHNAALGNDIDQIAASITI